jgi:hypothetical protein
MTKNNHIIIFAWFVLFLSTFAAGEKEGQQGSNPNHRIPKGIGAFESFIVNPKPRPAMNPFGEVKVDRPRINHNDQPSVVDVYNLPDTKNRGAENQVRPIRGQEQITLNRPSIVSKGPNVVQSSIPSRNVPTTTNVRSEMPDISSNNQLNAGKKAAQSLFEGIDPFQSMIIPKKRLIGFAENANIIPESKPTAIDRSVATALKDSQQNDNLRLQSLPKPQNFQPEFKKPIADPKFTIKMPTKVTSIYEMPPSKLNTSVNAYTLNRIQILFNIILDTVKQLKHLSVDLKNSVESLGNNMRILLKTLANSDDYAWIVDQFLVGFQDWLKSMTVVEYSDEYSATSHIVKYESEKFNKVLNSLVSLIEETKKRCKQASSSVTQSNSCAGVANALDKLTDSLAIIKSDSRPHTSFGNAKPMMSYGIKDENLDQIKRQFLKKQIDSKLQWIDSKENNLKAHLSRSQLYEPLKAILNAIGDYVSQSNSISALELIDSFLAKFDSEIALFESFNMKSSSSASKYLKIADQDSNQFIQHFKDFASNLLTASDKSNLKGAENINKIADNIEQVLKSAFNCRYKNSTMELIEGIDMCSKLNDALKVNQAGTRNTDKANKLVDFVSQSASKLEIRPVLKVSPLLTHFLNILKHAAQIIKSNPELVDSFGPIKEFIGSGFKLASSITTHQSTVSENSILYNTFEQPEAKNFGEALFLLNKKVTDLYKSNSLLRENPNSALLVQELGNCNARFNNLVNENGKMYELNDKDNIEYVLPQYAFSETEQKFVKAKPNRNTVYIHNNKTTLKALINSLTPKFHEVHITNFYKITVPALQVFINFYNDGKYSNDDVKKIEDLVKSLYDVLNTIQSTQTHNTAGPNRKTVTKTSFNQEKVNDLLTKIADLRKHGKNNWIGDSDSNSETPQVFDALDDIERFLSDLEKEKDGLIEYPNKDNQTFLAEHKGSTLTDSSIDQNELPINKEKSEVLENIVPIQAEDFADEEEFVATVRAQTINFEPKPKAADKIEKEMIDIDLPEPKKASSQSFVDNINEPNLLSNIATKGPAKKALLSSDDEKNLKEETELSQASSVTNSRIDQSVEHQSPRPNNRSSDLSSSKSSPTQTNHDAVSNPRSSYRSIRESQTPQSEISKISSLNHSQKSEAILIEEPELVDVDRTPETSNAILIDSVNSPNKNSKSSVTDSKTNIFVADESDSLIDTKNIVPNQIEMIEKVKGLENKSSKDSISDGSLQKINPNPDSSLKSNKNIPSNWFYGDEASVINKNNDSFDDTVNDSFIDAFEHTVNLPKIQSQRLIRDDRSVVSGDDRLANSFKSDALKQSMESKKSAKKESQLVDEENKSNTESESPSLTWSQKMRENNIDPYKQSVNSRVNVSQNPSDLSDYDILRASNRQNNPQIVPRRNSPLIDEEDEDLSKYNNLLRPSNDQNVSRISSSKSRKSRSFITDDQDSKIDLSNYFTSPRDTIKSEGEVASLQTPKSRNESQKSHSLNDSDVEHEDEHYDKVDHSVTSKNGPPQSILHDRQSRSNTSHSFFTLFGKEQNDRSFEDSESQITNILGKTFDEQPPAIISSAVMEPAKKPRRRVIVIMEVLNCTRCLDDSSLSFFVRQVLKIYK